MSFKNESFYYKNNVLQQIRGFCKAATLESIDKAAIALGLSNAAISAQINSLEKHLGYKLFKRSNNKIEITQRGKRFYEHSMPVLKQMNSLCEEFLIKNDQIEQNELRIGAYHSAIISFLPKCFKVLLKNFPDTKLHIENLSTKSAIDKLRKDELDIIFLPIKTEPIDFHILKKIRFRPTIVTSNDNKLSKKKIITPSDLAKQKILMVDNFQMLPVYSKIFEKYNIKNHITFINTTWEMIRYYVKANLGISFYGDLDPEQDKNDNICSIDISNMFPIIEYKILSTNKNIKHSVKNFLDSIDQASWTDTIEII